MPPATIVALHSDPRRLEEAGDDELMLLASGGSRAAFASLVRRHVRPLTGFCAKLTGDPEAARDVVQETFVQLWAARERYEPRGRFRVYLLKIAHNRARNHRRSSRRVERREAEVRLALVEQEGPEQLEALLRGERRRRIHAAMGRLPYKMREALLLRFDQEMDYPEIAAVLERPEATIRTRVFHGLRRLRTLLDGELLR